MSLGSWSVVARRAPPWTLTLAAATAVVFLVLAALVALRLTAASDLGWTLALGSIASDPLDLLTNAHTLLGQLVVTLAAAVALAIAAQRRLGGHAWLGPLFILATGAIEVVSKSIVVHPGPPSELSRSFWEPVLGIPRELHPPYAFPSGHVARLTFLVLTVAWLVPSRGAAIVVVALSAFNVFARVYIGDHWLSDALAGVALGTGAGAVAIAWMQATRRR